MLSLRSSKPSRSTPKIRLSRPYSAPALALRQRSGPAGSSDSQRKRDGQRTQSGTRTQRGLRPQENAWINPLDRKRSTPLPDVARLGSTEESYLQRTYRFWVKNSHLQSLEQAFALQKAIEVKFGPIESVRFNRAMDSNNLAYAPFFNVTFQSKLDDVPNTVEVEIPAPSSKLGGPSLTDIQPFFEDGSKPTPTSAEESQATDESSASLPSLIKVSMEVRQSAAMSYLRAADAPRRMGEVVRADFARLWTVFGGFTPLDSRDSLPLLRYSLEESTKFIERNVDSLSPSKFLEDRARALQRATESGEVEEESEEDPFMRQRTHNETLEPEGMLAQERPSGTHLEEAEATSLSETSNIEWEPLSFSRSSTVVPSHVTRRNGTQNTPTRSAPATTSTVAADPSDLLLQLESVAKLADQRKAELDAIERETQLKSMRDEAERRAAELQAELEARQAEMDASTAGGRRAKSEKERRAREERERNAAYLAQLELVKKEKQAAVRSKQDAAKAERAKAEQEKRERAKAEAGQAAEARRTARAKAAAEATAPPEATPNADGERKQSMFGKLFGW